MQISPLAGKPAHSAPLMDIGQLVGAYCSINPDWQQPSELAAFGTSGHRGSSLAGSFNADHILAISQSGADYHSKENIAGALFMGFDMHALSALAVQTALEVLAANVDTVLEGK